MREHTNQDQGGSNEQYSQLGQEFGRHVIQLTSELLVKTGQPKSLSEMERGIRQMLLKLGQFLLGAWLALQKEPYPAETKGCPHCKAEAEYQFRREASLLTLVGVVLYKRAYYLCADCRQGHYPLDERLGLRPRELSAELESLTAMTGVQLPFEQSSRLFEALTLISVSDHSVAKAAQAMGSEVEKLEDGLIEHKQAGEAAKKAVTYFTNNRHRMNYAEYRAKGYQIGSGTVESGCKQIVTQRLKVAGAIWDLDNCIKTAKARAALLSNQWSAITDRREHLPLTA